jgi:hypothetical protein
MTNLTSIAPDSPLCKTLNCLPEKFVVDFANGIDVVRDHVRVQRGRTDFFSRLYDGFNGQGTRRQAAIHASLSDGLEASLQWLRELTESQAHSNWAIAQVNDRVTALTGDMAHLVHYSADTRRQLEELAHQLDMRMQGIAQEVARIDFIQKAQLSVDATFSKWAAGRFATLAPAARCYAALEELRWGAFGDYCRNYSRQRQCREFMEMVTHRAMTQLAEDTAVSLESPVNTIEVWLTAPPARSGSRDEMQQALAYLADGMGVDAAPFVNSVVQQRPASLSVPLIARAERVAEAMVQEVFPREVAYV